MGDVIPHKKKVICYGVGNYKIRSMVNLCLSDDYEIIGYSDSFYEQDVLQGEYFIKPEKIKEFDFDKILILVKTASIQKEIRSWLIEKGGYQVTK